MSVESMKKLLLSMPKKKGFGHERKLDMLNTTDRLMSITRKRIADYNKGKIKDIDKLLWQCAIDAMRIQLVLAQGKVKSVLYLTKCLVEAQRELWIQGKKKETGTGNNNGRAFTPERCATTKR